MKWDLCGQISPSVLERCRLRVVPDPPTLPLWNLSRGHSGEHGLGEGVNASSIITHTNLGQAHLDCEYNLPVHQRWKLEREMDWWHSDFSLYTTNQALFSAGIRKLNKINWLFFSAEELWWWCVCCIPFLFSCFIVVSCLSWGRVAEYATPKYATLAHWFFWAIGTWKTANTGRGFLWTPLLCL